MKRTIGFFSVLLLVTLMVSSCGLTSLAPALTSKALPLTGTSGTASAAAAPVTDTAPSLAAFEAAFEDIYSQVSPSVVNIQVTQKQAVSSSTLPGLQGFPFFFGLPSSPNQQSPQNQPQEFYSHGAGSGFVWDKQGHIITNNHVVDGADTISVVFADGNTVPAQVVGTDPDSDLAVLKVDVPSDQLSPITLANSEDVKVGQFAIAIGNPFGLQGTMTVGIVSALGRSLPATAETQATGQGPTYTIPEIIQTDAPINPGNSGGVLVNDQGEVIGVTAAIQSPVRASAGIGFAIPADIVGKVVPALITDGHYEHSWLGLSGMTLIPELAQAMDLPADQHGALVITVTPDGPADKAGIQGSDRQITIEGQQVSVGGDVITAIDGQPVNDFEDMVAYLVDHTEANQKVTLTILRNGKEQDITATLTARPNSENQLQLGQSNNTNGGQAWLGINGVTVSPEIAQAMNLSADQQGVLVEQVQVGSPADQANLHGSFKPQVIAGQQLAVGGDIITDINGQPVAGMQELQTFIQSAQPGQKITLTILRNGEQMEVSVTLGERS